MIVLLTITNNSSTKHTRLTIRQINAGQLLNLIHLFESFGNLRCHQNSVCQGSATERELVTSKSISRDLTPQILHTLLKFCLGRTTAQPVRQTHGVTDKDITCFDVINSMMCVVTIVNTLSERINFKGNTHFTAEPHKIQQLLDCILQDGTH